MRMEEMRGGVSAYQDSSTNDGTTGSLTPGSSGTTQGNSPPSGGDQGTSGNAQSPFTHEALRQMRTPSEVEQYVQRLESAVREQGAALSAAVRQSTASPAPAQNQGQGQGQGGNQGERSMPTKDDFWNDPVGGTQQVVSRVLEQQLAPLVQELRSARMELVTPNLREPFRQDPTNFPNFKDLEPHINTYLQTSGKLGSETDADLRQAYYSVFGWAVTRNLITPGQSTGSASNSGQPSTTNGGGNVNNNSGAGNNNERLFFPPQHAASSAPLPGSGGGGGGGGGEIRERPLRELTESERVIASARWSGLPYEEQRRRYLAWIDVPDDQVVSSQIGRESK